MNERKQNIKMTKIPCLPLKKPDFQHDKPTKVGRYIEKWLERKHILKKCNKKDEQKRYYICSNHEMETVTQTHKVQRTNNKKQATMTVRHTFEVPKPIGMKTAAPSKRGVSKGTGNERVFNRLVSNVEIDLSQLDSTESEGDANAKMLVDAATSNARLTMQSYEKIDRLRAEISACWRRTKS